MTVKLSGLGSSHTARWFNPRTESESSAGTLAGGSDHTLTPPSIDDWVLWLLALYQVLATKLAEAGYTVQTIDLAGYSESRARAAGEAFADTANWGWFTGAGRTWGSGSVRVPVLRDPAGFMRSSVMYTPGLDRYIMATNHTARNLGNIAFWEAPKPWGSWTLIWKKSGWPARETSVVDPTFAFGSFSPKWLSADGSDCVSVWFRPDAWNSIRCRFETPP